METLNYEPNNPFKVDHLPQDLATKMESWLTQKNNTNYYELLKHEFWKQFN